jgi:predicted Rossmann-fold nucleotide-binding protein
MYKEKEVDQGLSWIEYKEKENIGLVIGVIGGASLENLPVAEKILMDGFVEARQTVGKFAILSGGTEGGVPEMSVRVAQKLGLPSVGVYPASVEKKSLGEKLGYKHPVPTPDLCEIKWGVETPVLTSLGDVFVLFGGEWGSLVEVGMIMKRNKGLVGNGEAPIPLIVVKDSGPVVKHIIDMTNEFGHQHNGLIAIHNGHDLGHALTAMFS